MHSTPLGDASIESCVTSALRNITHALDRDGRDLVRHLGVSRTQVSVLRELAKAEGLSPGEIARRLQLAQATVSESVHKLAEAGYVELARNELDKRRIACSITDSGRALSARCPPSIGDRLMDTLSRLPEWERLYLVSTLQRVALMIEEQTASSSDPAPVTESMGSRDPRAPASEPRSS